MTGFASSQFHRYRNTIVAVAVGLAALASLIAGLAVIAAAPSDSAISVTDTTLPVTLTSYITPARATTPAAPAILGYRTVTRGETLAIISQAAYRNAKCWPGVYRENSRVIGGNPDLIRIGQRLAIPAACDTRPVYIPAAKTVTRTTAVVTKTTPVTANSSFEACVISRESGGDPTIVNPSSGAGGLFQFLPSTWDGYDGYPNAESAPVSVQEEYFNIVYAAQGVAPWRPYDGC
jgi:resuscitation-promoting factor RpfC